MITTKILKKFNDYLYNDFDGFDGFYNNTISHIELLNISKDSLILKYDISWWYSYNYNQGPFILSYDIEECYINFNNVSISIKIVHVAQNLNYYSHICDNKRSIK